MYVHGLPTRKRPSKRHDVEWRFWRFLMRLSELLRQDEARPQPPISLHILQFQLIDPDAVLPEPEPTKRIPHHRHLLQRRHRRPRREFSVEQELRA
jgi:hypothetical protein